MKKIALIINCLGLSVLTNAQSPAFQWAKNAGSVSNDIGYSIAVDASGNVYTTGYFYDTADFDPGPGIFNLTSAGSNDIFILKLDASGNFMWAKNMGGISNDKGHSIAVDGSGNVYITGYFYETADFDPGAGIVNLTSGGSSDIFILKLDASGNFMWAKNMGGSYNDEGASIAVDALGNIYSTGFFVVEGDFDSGPGIVNLTSAGLSDIFILKLDASGNFIWAKNLGGVSNDKGLAIAVDAPGNVYTTGYFYGTGDFDPNAGIVNLSSAGSEDIFVSKLNAYGNFIWAKNIGGISSDQGYAIAVDASGSVYTTGLFLGTADFDPGAGIYNLTSAGYLDIFISKLNASGNFMWAKNMGGTSADRAFSIASDASGNIYTTGFFEGTADFDPGTGIYNLTSVNSNAFISKLDVSGNFEWATSIGGTLSVVGYSVALDVSGNVYTTGHFAETADFDPGAGTFNLTSLGGNDIWVHKMNQCILPSAMITPGGPTTFCSGGSVVLNAPTGANKTYQWKKGANLISGATLSSYTATTGGNYRVIITNTVTGCSKTTNSATTVTVNPLPAATITPQGPITFCAGGSVVLSANTGTGLTYKWKKGSTYISGATLSNYTATTGGNYRVQVTNSNACSKTSALVAVSVPCREGESVKTGEGESVVDMNVYPNPNSGEFTIKFLIKPTSPVQIELTDEIGKVVRKFETNERTVVIKESNLAEGIYCLTARNNNEVAVKKINIVK